jgi:hypothetical protein
VVDVDNDATGLTLGVGLDGSEAQTHRP